MPKGLFTQGVVVLYDKEITIDQIKPQLKNYCIINEVEASESLDISGPSVVIEYDNVQNGKISIDVANKKWPDHMGDPETDAMLFGAWTMGHYGPFTYPNGLARSLQQSWIWPEAKENVEKHKSFVRIRSSYVFGSSEDKKCIPENYNAEKELQFITLVASDLLNNDNAICYFNPNGEVIIPKQNLDEMIIYHKTNNLPPLSVWSNIRLFNVNDDWLMMDSVGSMQYEIPDQEVCFPKNQFNVNDVDFFIRNVILYLMKNGLIIKLNDTMDGPGNLTWQMKLFENGLTDPPRQVMRWFPLDHKDIPQEFLNSCGM